jgi:hypothetical protein
MHPMGNGISTRREMAERLELIMTKSYDSLKDELRLERNHSLLKTYLIEAHTSAHSSPSQINKLLREAFDKAKGRRRGLNFSVDETSDQDLFTAQGSSGRDQFIFYIDTSDRRFWIAHSISKSGISDSMIESILNNSTRLDSMWMPMELLGSLLRDRMSRGLGLDFDRRYLDRPLKGRKDEVASNASDKAPSESPVLSSRHLEYVKMQLWGEGAERILKALQSADLKQSTTISKVRLKTEDSSDRNRFSLADVRFDGKITGRGTSFAIYNGLLADLLQIYSKTIRDTETKFRLHWEAETGKAKAFGQPFYINLGEEGASDLEHFCARVFSGTEPFRLMGIPVRRSTSFYTVSAVDLHINQRVDFEISRRTLTVFLPSKACGNSLLRLYTNLQHYFSSDVKAIDGSGSAVFNF